MKTIFYYSSLKRGNANVLVFDKIIIIIKVIVMITIIIKAIIAT